MKRQVRDGTNGSSESFRLERHEEPPLDTPTVLHGDAPRKKEQKLKRKWKRAKRRPKKKKKKKGKQIHGPDETIQSVAYTLESLSCT